MDKQTNVLTNAQNIIPVNTRTIGAPEGIYILYLEDYVHTFIKKILSDNPQNVLLGNKHKKEEEQEYQIEQTPQQSIALYGRTIEESGRYRIVISGAAAVDGSSGKIQQVNNTYFPSCSYIGNASVSLNKDSRLRLELTLRSTKVILDDFYIYYDQNEEMQNYLVEWNTTREGDKGKVVLSPTEHDTSMRNSRNDAAHLGKIAQAYNREEAKVSFMWNVMNVLCLGFVVCVMAYGIISMNNYNKMQNMQASIDYCMAFIEENTSFLINNTGKTGTGQSQPASAMQQNVQIENELAKLNGTQKKEQGTDTAAEADQSAQEMQALAQPAIISRLQDGTTQIVAGQDTQPAQGTAAQSNAGQGATAQSEAGQNITAQTEAGQNTTAQSEEGQNTTVQSNAGQDTATQTEAGQNSVQSNAGQNTTAQSNAGQDTQLLTGQNDAAQSVTGQDTQMAKDTVEQSDTGQDMQGQSSTPQYYVVRRGDTLRTICYDIYGNYSRVDEICRWNNIDNPDNILYGQKLLLP